MLIVQLFQWSWASVAAECAWIGAAGYTHVQVRRRSVRSLLILQLSPAVEHIVGDSWSTSYACVDLPQAL